MKTQNTKQTRPTGRARRYLPGAGVALLALFGLVACEGDNLFTGENSASRPRVDVIAPAVILSGDSFQVRLDAQAPRGLSRIDLSLTGAMQRDTSYLVPGTSANASPVFRYRLPDLFVGDMMIILARVVDKAGVSSPPVADTVTAIMRTQ